jgi:uncharacterized membrane protein YphA (DoxX/SURF4 family)
MKNVLQINWKKISISVLRMAIGWHFLYEGISKLIIPNWTSYSYLANTTGSLSGFYHWIAASPGILKIADVLNIWGLILIGIALFIGLFSQFAAIAGAFLLTLYYFAYPPFGDSLFNLGEGHLFVVDKIFIEGMALIFIVFFKEKGFGIDFFVEKIRKSKSRTQSVAT